MFRIGEISADDPAFCYVVDPVASGSRKLPRLILEIAVGLDTVATRIGLVTLVLVWGIPNKNVA